jgi:hypothetical protein
MPKQTLIEYGNKIGEFIKPNMDCGRYNHACSDMISIEMIAELGLVSDLCKHSYTEIINSFSLMTRWVNLSKTVDCIRIAVEHWLDINGEVVFDNYYLKSSMDEYPIHIHEDICVFAAWVIYNGADGASIRRTMPTKIQEQTRIIVRKIGVSGIISMLWRSLIAFQSMTDKCIIPAYKECFKHGAKEQTSFNQMQSAFAQLKKSA